MLKLSGQQLKIKTAIADDNDGSVANLQGAYTQL